ncbi:GAF domain-containing protein [Geodermatophilus sp. CPCC 205506]|uniref:GAF domain-containing protein n=1 Tax=Geodermatophilus sp. CPCC 205506 TaxID=2936596 RepID=UPI003F53306A
MIEGRVRANRATRAKSCTNWRRSRLTRWGDRPGGARDLLRSTTELTRRLFDAAACALALPEAESEQLVFRSASGAGAARIVGQRLPVGQGIAGWAVSSGQPIGIAEVARDPRFARGVAEATGYVPRSILAVPLGT